MPKVYKVDPELIINIYPPFDWFRKKLVLQALDLCSDAREGTGSGGAKQRYGWRLWTCAMRLVMAVPSAPSGPTPTQLNLIRGKAGSVTGSADPGEATGS